MTQSPLLECSFLIPLHRDANLSDGMRQSTEAWDWLDHEMYSSFDGGTIAPGEYEGSYRDPDTHERVFDKSRKFVVAVQAHRLDELRAMLAAACVIFGQKCIYLSVAGQVEFVTYELS